MPPYAQTNIQLFNQLRREGYSNEEILLVRNAHELAIHLFTGLYRPSGDTFISHLVGTASILASQHTPINIVTGGLLHAAYIHGDFGIIGLMLMSEKKRRKIREVVGDVVEDHIARYTRLKWSSRAILDISDRLDNLAPIDRDVLSIRLANELEDSLNCGVLYCSNAHRRREYIERWGPDMAEMADRLGFPVLASELSRVFKEVTSTEIPKGLHIGNGRNHAYLIAPRSYCLGLSFAFCHTIFIGMRFLSKLCYKMRMNSVGALFDPSRG
jgi:(p)ppGpp synthase/HD superfamily hydrolase